MERAQVIVCPAIGVSHGISIMELALRLVEKGFKAVVVHDSEHLARLTDVWTCPPEASPFIDFRAVRAVDDNNDEKDRERWMYEFMSILAELEPASTVLIIDSFARWALHWASDLCLPYAIYFPEPATVAALELQVAASFRKVMEVACLSEKEIHWKLKRAVSLLEGVPSLDFTDLPAYMQSPREYKELVNVYLDDIRYAHGASFFLVNSYEELEPLAFRTMQKLYGSTFLAIARHFPRIEPAVEKREWQHWLDGCPPGSVVYLGIGSGPTRVTPFPMEYLERIALHLGSTHQRFLLVLPRYQISETLKQSMKRFKAHGRLVLEWANQREVLGHQAIGCMVTHCGWNSVLDAIYNGIPMVAMPYRAEQPTNRKLLVDVWKCAIDYRDGNRPFASIVSGVFNTGQGEELRRNVSRLRKLVMEASQRDRSLNHFVAAIQQLGWKATAARKAMHSIFSPFEVDEDEDPEDAKLFGNELYKEGDYQGSLCCYNKALDHLFHCKKPPEESRAMVYNNMAACYLKLEQPEEALNCCNKSIENKASLKALYRQAQAYLAVKEFDSAVASLNRAFELRPDNSEVLKLLKFAKRQASPT